ncbi:MAG: discoidin domain-containing protein, partial [Oscillospiraceae bacterium]|nr:discoidin domain-containing protein [Oscillospiraceae bacterium]
TAGEEPEPTDPTDPTDPPVVVDPADDSRDIPLEVLTVSTGNFEPNGGSSEGPAELAVDNNHSTIWHTDWYGESRDDHWFQFEIDGEYNVDGLRILPRQAGNTNGIITEYDIQVSEDGETWKSVATGNWEADREWKLVSFGAEHVKYVRMYALDGVTDNAYVFASAAEIRITGEEWVAPPEEWNLGLESKIIAYNGTKLGDDAGPEKLFNGSWSDEALDKWCEDGKDLWVAFDLGGEASVSSISIYHAGANNEWMPAGASTNTEAYELYVLNTEQISVSELMGMSLAARTDLLGSSAYWTPIATVTGNTEDITTHELDLTGARIFKFNVSDTDSTNWASCVRVYEIEVMGTITGSGGGTTPEPGAADKSALNALIDLCEMYEKGNYTDESWNAFQAALTAAQTVAADPNATQAAVDAAREALSVALVSLEEKGEEPEPPVEPGVQKILHLDSGRTLYSKDWTIALLNEMAAAGYTHLQLAFGNDGLRFVLDDMTIEANGKTYTSDEVKAGIELGNENYNKTHSTKESDGFCYDKEFTKNALTEAEMDEIIAHAKSVGIEIIPHVNMPGHMDALLDAIEYLGIADAHFTGYTKSERSLNLNSAEAVAFTQALLAKYADYFAENGSAYFHIGADEYANDAYSGSMGFPAMGATLYAKFAEFVNQNAAIVKDRGMTARAWNDGIRYTRYSAEFDTDIEITYWSSGWWGYDVAKPAKFAELGHGLINTHGDYYYILGVNDKFTPGDSPEHDPNLYTEAASYDINTFMGGTVENPIGGMFCIWGDHPFGESEQEVGENIRLILRAMALRMDGKTLDGMDTAVVEGGFNEDGSINGAEQPHEHAFGEWTTVTEPTCTDKGLEERKCECGETETREIAALGHTEAEAVKENEVAPTCTENGSYDLVVYCAECDAEISRETVTVDALGHDFVNGKCQRCDAVLESEFEDVAAGAFYFDPVQWAVDKEITAGTTPTTFDPNG